MCLKGVPSVENEILNNVLDKVKSLIKESGFDIPDVVIDRAHRIRKGHKTRNVSCNSINC